MNDFNNGLNQNGQDNEDNKNDINAINTSENFDAEDSNAANNQNNQEGVQADKKELEGKSENNGEEKTGNEAQGAGYEEQVSINAAQPRYSSCYSPPYYVPNFTVAQPSTVPETKKSKKSKVWIIVLVAVLCAVLVMFVTVCGLFALMMSSVNNSPELNMEDEQMTVIQNAPQIDVVQSTDPTYVPKSLPEVVSKVGNSVVEIKTSSRVADRFYGQYVTSGAGSGVIVAQSEVAGYLLTNHHVIHNEDDSVVDSITVVLTNGEEYVATKIDSDQSIDLALVRIEKKANEVFTVAEFGDSSKLVVGQDVIAIGNPLGSLGGTVTDGIISALDRRVQIDGVTMVLLQHNAAINPGNSGGALFDMMGNLVGIVNAKTSETGIEGLGFAIPANIAFDYFNRVMVIEPAMGIRVAYGRPDRVSPLGVYVTEVSNPEFQRFDRIIKVNGTDVATAADYYAVIDGCKVGDTVTITVVRDSQTLDISVVIEGKE